ncbi:MAG TPA: hypothetical protein VFW48_09790 [Solirubrobacterales bacterium]|nr:hypothetical protein [Solirubrobacterales bacterium]
MKRHLNPATVISCIALFVALSGVAVAAKTTLGNGAVTTPKLRNGAVTTPKLRNGAVTTGKLRNGAVTGAKVRSGAIGSAQLADGGVRSVDLGGGVVTEAKLKNDAVSGSKLQDGAVSSAKLAPSFLAQLARNVSYVNKLSAEDSEGAKSVTAECPSSKQAIGGGARVNGELAEVAITGSNPFVSGDGARTGWTAMARESTATGSSWSVEAFAVCAEL